MWYAIIRISDDLDQEVTVPFFCTAKSEEDAVGKFVMSLSEEDRGYCLTEQWFTRDHGPLYAVKEVPHISIGVDAQDPPDRLPESDFGIICTENSLGGKGCGHQGLSEAEYRAQMMRPDSLWRCPVCKNSAMWDDDRYAKAEERMEKKKQD